MHLLIAHERLSRRRGVTAIDGLPKSTLFRKLVGRTPPAYRRSMASVEV